ncbi:hypothetical protein HII31_01388 [Pseudocercospora fuligena]|uniref:Actin cortical patch SUR7/pH-response regulator PalI n=1 Tax=Pseudocercospora fuligena TaxID=685502 RepID=A0A8H6VNY9_9PEZI|nr:hypothetical protein HII31_01388 [Pseudocercospora fuligena]
MAGPRQFQPYAILPVLVTFTAFVLTFLCVFAGNKPGMMDDYAVFTLNVSRIGQNAVNKIDDKIMGFNISKIVSKRDLPAEVEAFPTPVTHAPRAEITLAPELDIALMARDIDSLVGDLTEGVASLKSEAGGKITSVQSAIESKATAIASGVESGINSIEALAANKISSALNSAQTSVVEAINDTYMDFIEEMDLSDFYAIHLRTTCSGEYVMPNGTNVTIGVSAPPPNGTEKHIISCDQHSNLNPLIFIRVCYYVGIICLGLALLLSIWSVISFSRKKVIANVILILPALGFLALASVSSHGIAIGAAAVLNFLGDGIGIQANKGGKFIALTWATTILVLPLLGNHKSKACDCDFDIFIPLNNIAALLGYTITMQDSGIAELIEFVKASSKRDSGILSTAPSYNSKSASAPIATQDSKISKATEAEAEETSPMNDSVVLPSPSHISNSTNAPIAEHEPSSGERVASIAELLEQILLDLDLTSYEGVRTLLLSQRTSKAFRDTIANTPSLQRALHFSLSHKR